MRTPRQQFYDHFYYDFELWLETTAMDLRKRFRFRRIKFDPAFYDAYKNQVLPYWRKFGVKPNIVWYKHYYLLTKKVDPRFIPDDIHMRWIIPYFDNSVYVRQLADKNLHSLMFPGVKRPETVYKRAGGFYYLDDFTPISREEALARAGREGSYIVKPTRDSGMGTDIRFFSGAHDRPALEQLLAPYAGIDHIVQKTVVQHPALAAFNATSLNTVRIVTVMLPSGTYLLSSVLRIGGPGSQVDNISRGGYQAVIRPDGTLDKLAYTHNGGKDAYVEQTQSGIRFENYPIPSWEKLRATALDLASRLPHLKHIGWDFAVDEQGDVVLIEFNCQIGQNQATCGPTFGDLTDEVLGLVFAEKKGKKGKNVTS